MRAAILRYHITRRHLYILPNSQRLNVAHVLKTLVIYRANDDGLQPDMNVIGRHGYRLQNSLLRISREHYSNVATSGQLDTAKIRSDAAILTALYYLPSSAYQWKF